MAGAPARRVTLPVFLVEDGLVTDGQVRRLREKRMSGKTLAAAAAAAGMSERTARKWQRGALPSTAKAPRTWRTREDPFADVWQSEVVPQLVADTDGRLQVLTLFTALCRRHPGRFQPGQLRTLQRRVREWRVQYGPDREVYFEQVAVPGREAAFDFTDASDLAVTLGGVAFPHLLFEWVLSCSRWTYVGLALSETFEALVAGVQDALWTLGAVPAVLRHDNLSAATHELRRSGGRQLTVRFRQVLDHYGLRSSRIQPGKPHENGVAEQSHFRTKTAVEQALLLRGDRDFVDEAAYLRFVRMVVDEERNAPAAARLAEEWAYLRPLPSARIPEYTTFVVGLLKPRFSGRESTGLIDEVGAWSFCCVTTARALAVSLLLTELGLSSAIAVAFEKQDLGMVGQAVDQSDGARGVGEDGVPAFEG